VRNSDVTLTSVMRLLSHLLYAEANECMRVVSTAAGSDRRNWRSAWKTVLKYAVICY